MPRSFFNYFHAFMVISREEWLLLVNDTQFERSNRFDETAQIEPRIKGESRRMRPEVGIKEEAPKQAINSEPGEKLGSLEWSRGKWTKFGHEITVKWETSPLIAGVFLFLGGPISSLPFFTNEPYQQWL